MWGQSFELEHSQAAGAQAMLVLIAICVGITLAAAVFTTTIVRGVDRQAAVLSQAAAAAKTDTNVTPAV